MLIPRKITKYSEILWAKTLQNYFFLLLIILLHHCASFSRKKKLKTLLSQSLSNNWSEFLIDLSCNILYFERVCNLHCIHHLSTLFLWELVKISTKRFIEELKKLRWVYCEEDWVILGCSLGVRQIYIVDRAESRSQ